MRERGYLVNPFIKWAGGKRQLLEHIHNCMPQDYNNYIEPFVGGGAVLFNLQPQRAYINDINRALINTYNQIKHSPEEVMEITHQYDLRIQDDSLDKDGQKEVYYAIREEYNEKLLNEEYDAKSASLLLFLNKHCFNGLYRVNAKKGTFNVPFSNSTRASFKRDNILEVSEYLQNVEILNGDFEELCNNAQLGDFVFLDSPYAPIRDDSFVSYTKEGFERNDHIRLAGQFRAMSRRGCFCMLTNHNTPFINELYKGYNIQVVQVKRLINRNADDRTGEEVIITNY